MSETSAYSGHQFTPEARNNSWSNMYGFVPDGGRVLDVGCSVGNFGEALERLKGCTVVGVDLNADDIAIAATRLSEAYVLDVSDAEAIGVLGTFDAILFADVIEHLVDPRATLRTIRSLLNPGGIVVYSIPNMGHLSVRLDLLEGRFPYTETGLLDKTHLHYYDAHEIEDVFTAAGFGIIEEEPVVAGYPRGWIDDRLVRLGLTASDEFFAALDESESNVFQYVGVAIPLSGLPRNPAPPVRKVMPVDELLNYANEITIENEHLKNTDDLNVELIAAKAELSRTQDERDAIRHEFVALRDHVAFVKRHPFAFLKRTIDGRLRRGRR